MPEGDRVSVFFEPYSPVLTPLIRTDGTTQPDLQAYCESQPHAAYNQPRQSLAAKT